MLLQEVPVVVGGGVGCRKRKTALLQANRRISLQQAELVWKCFGHTEHLLSAHDVKAFNKLEPNIEGDKVSEVIKWDIELHGRCGVRDRDPLQISRVDSFFQCY